MMGCTSKLWRQILPSLSYFCQVLVTATQKVTETVTKCCMGAQQARLSPFSQLGDIFHSLLEKEQREPVPSHSACLEALAPPLGITDFLVKLNQNSL